MRRIVGRVLGIAIVATVVAGCLVRPSYYDHYGNDRDGAGYNPPYDDYDYRRPSQAHHDHGDDQLPTIVCASQDGRAKRCPTDFPIKRAEVDKRYSGSPCEYGRSWGYDGNEVWVDRGCRARFILHPAGRRR